MQQRIWQQVSIIPEAETSTIKIIKAGGIKSISSCFYFVYSIVQIIGAYSFILKLCNCIMPKYPGLCLIWGIDS